MRDVPYMPYVARVLKDEQYLERLARLEELEADRRFCRHDLAHFTDVARLAWIRDLEEKGGLDREMIYLYALLHDMGRVEEYEQGISHAQASAAYAGEIFSKIGYPKERADVICSAILEHRGNTLAKRKDTRAAQQTADGGVYPAADGTAERFAELTAWADHASRMCFRCPAQAECNWAEERRNRPETWR